MNTIPCRSCEMQSSCRKANHCWRPQDSAHWAKEVEAAQPIFQAAAQRLIGALAALQEAIRREQEQVIHKAQE